MIKDYSDYRESSVNYVKDKVVAITGAGSGFGRLITYEVVKMGGKVVISDINEETLKETVTEAEKLAPGSVIYFVGNAGKLSDVEAMVNLGIDTFGQIDVFIANAGTMPLAPFEDHATAMPAWETCIDVNLKGTMYAISATYDQFIKQGRGHFISISSIYGNFPVYGGGVYQATKIGVRYLAHSLRTESAGKIKVSIVSPTGITATNLINTVVSLKGATGVWGQNFASYKDNITAIRNGTAAPEKIDQDNVQYYTLRPEELVWGVMFVLNQPWGVNIGDITVRATGDEYLL